MKTKLCFKKAISYLIIVFFALSATTELNAQEKKPADLKEFKIIVEKTEDGIKMTCTKGCAWKELTFNLKVNKTQAIDEYGMTELNKNSSAHDPDLVNLLFTLTRTNEGIRLKGIEGTVWTDLSFSLPVNKKQAIDQSGMIGL